jgi:hypothetical protein
MDKVQLPNEIYYIAGVIILTNVGTLVTLFFAAFRSVWWLSKLDSRVAETKAMAVRAHKRIDQMDQKDL